MTAYPANMAEHRAGRSLDDYLAELVERLDATPIDHLIERVDLRGRIALVEHLRDRIALVEHEILSRGGA